MATSVAGSLIAFYQIGYGIAAFGVGPLQNWAGWSLPAIFSGTAIIGLGMAALSFLLVQGQHEAKSDSQPATTH